MVLQGRGDVPKMPGLHEDCGEGLAADDILSNARLDLVAEFVVRKVYDTARIEYLGWTTILSAQLLAWMRLAKGIEDYTSITTPWMLPAGAEYDFQF